MNWKGKRFDFLLDSLPPARKNKLPFSSYLPSSVYVNFASCYCSNGRDGEMLLISFLRRIFFSKQLVLTRTKQPRNSMLISQISSNVRALYIVSALAEMKQLIMLMLASHLICLTQGHFHYRLPEPWETGSAHNSKGGQRMTRGFVLTSRKIPVHVHNVLFTCISMWVCDCIHQQTLRCVGHWWLLTNPHSTTEEHRLQD